MMCYVSDINIYHLHKSFSIEILHVCVNKSKMQVVALDYWFLNIVWRLLRFGLSLSLYSCDSCLLIHNLDPHDELIFQLQVHSLPWPVCFCMMRKGSQPTCPLSIQDIVTMPSFPSTWSVYWHQFIEGWWLGLKPDEFVSDASSTSWHALYWIPY